MRLLQSWIRRILLIFFFLLIVNNMKRKLDEQTKTIQFIKTKYKQKTGQQIIMPMGWQDYLCLDEDEVPAQPLPQIKRIQEQKLTFLMAIDKLNLPSRLSYSKPPLTSFSPANKFHMIETISLSNFKQKGFNKNSLRQLLSRIIDMRCLRMLDLSRNGLGQECAQQIQVLFGIKRITRVDLSRNQMGKTCLQIINKNFNHLQWIDISRNAFIFETFSLNALLNSIRVNGKIYHMQMDWQDPKMLTTFASYLKLKPHLRSLGPIDSKITPEAMEYICHVLAVKDSKKDNYRLNSLNFNFCYLQKPLFAQLTKALAGNLTLIRLVLSNNHLGEQAILPFLAVLEGNLTLVELNLAGNLLEDRFAGAFAVMLAKNQILQVVDISKNNIGIDGGASILKALSEGNDIVESLGQFQTNERMGSELIQKIKRALRINRISREVRSKILSQEPDLPISEIASRQTEAFLDSQLLQYELLQPLVVTNPLRQGPSRFHLWKFV